MIFVLLDILSSLDSIWIYEKRGERGLRRGKREERWDKRKEKGERWIGTWLYSDVEHHYDLRGVPLWKVSKISTASSIFSHLSIIFPPTFFPPSHWKNMWKDKQALGLAVSTREHLENVNHTHKDSILFYSSDAKTSLTATEWIVGCLSPFPGYKINFSKSLIIPPGIIPKKSFFQQHLV